VEITELDNGLSRSMTMLPGPRGGGGVVTSANFTVAAQTAVAQYRPIVSSMSIFENRLSEGAAPFSVDTAPVQNCSTVNVTTVGVSGNGSLVNGSAANTTTVTQQTICYGNITSTEVARPGANVSFGATSASQLFVTVRFEAPVSHFDARRDLAVSGLRLVSQEATTKQVDPNPPPTDCGAVISAINAQLPTANRTTMQLNQARFNATPPECISTQKALLQDSPLSLSPASTSYTLGLQDKDLRPTGVALVFHDAATVQPDSIARSADVDVNLFCETAAFPELHIDENITLYNATVLVHKHAVTMASNTTAGYLESVTTVSFNSTCNSSCYAMACNVTANRTCLTACLAACNGTNTSTVNVTRFPTYAAANLTLSLNGNFSLYPVNCTPAPIPPAPTPLANLTVALWRREWTALFNVTGSTESVGAVLVPYQPDLCMDSDAVDGLGLTPSASKLVADLVDAGNIGQAVLEIANAANRLNTTAIDVPWTTNSATTLCSQTLPRIASSPRSQASVSVTAFAAPMHLEFRSVPSLAPSTLIANGSFTLLQHLWAFQTFSVPVSRLPLAAFALSGLQRVPNLTASPFGTTENVTDAGGASRVWALQLSVIEAAAKLTVLEHPVASCADFPSSDLGANGSCSSLLPVPRLRHNPSNAFQVASSVEFRTSVVRLRLYEMDEAGNFSALPTTHAVTSRRCLRARVEFDRSLIALETSHFVLQGLVARQCTGATAANPYAAVPDPSVPALAPPAERIPGGEQRVWDLMVEVLDPSDGTFSFTMVPDATATGRRTAPAFSPTSLSRGGEYRAAPALVGLIESRWLPVRFSSDEYFPASFNTSEPIVASPRGIGTTQSPSLMREPLGVTSWPWLFVNVTFEAAVSRLEAEADVELSNARPVPGSVAVPGGPSVNNASTLDTLKPVAEAEALLGRPLNQSRCIGPAGTLIDGVPRTLEQGTACALFPVCVNESTGALAIGHRIPGAWPELRCDPQAAAVVWPQANYTQYARSWLFEIEALGGADSVGAYVLPFREEVCALGAPIGNATSRPLAVPAASQRCSGSVPRIGRAFRAPSSAVANLTAYPVESRFYESNHGEVGGRLDAKGTTISSLLWAAITFSVPVARVPPEAFVLLGGIEFAGGPPVAFHGNGTSGLGSRTWGMLVRVLANSSRLAFRPNNISSCRSLLVARGLANATSPAECAQGVMPSPPIDIDAVSGRLPVGVVEALAVPTSIAAFEDLNGDGLVAASERQLVSGQATFERCLILRVTFPTGVTMLHASNFKLQNMRPAACGAPNVTVQPRMPFGGTEMSSETWDLSVVVADGHDGNLTATLVPGQFARQTTVVTTVNGTSNSTVVETTFSASPELQVPASFGLELFFQTSVSNFSVSQVPGVVGAVSQGKMQLDKGVELDLAASARLAASYAASVARAVATTAGSAWESGITASTFASVTVTYEALVRWFDVHRDMRFSSATALGQPVSEDVLQAVIVTANDPTSWPFNYSLCWTNATRPGPPVYNCTLDCASVPTLTTNASVAQAFATPANYAKFCAPASLIAANAPSGAVDAFPMSETLIARRAPLLSNASLALNTYSKDKEFQVRLLGLDRSAEAKALPFMSKNCVEFPSANASEAVRLLPDVLPFASCSRMQPKLSADPSQTWFVRFEQRAMVLDTDFVTRLSSAAAAVVAPLSYTNLTTVFFRVRLSLPVANLTWHSLYLKGVEANLEPAWHADDFTVYFFNLTVLDNQLVLSARPRALRQCTAAQAATGCTLPVPLLHWASEAERFDRALFFEAETTASLRAYIPIPTPSSSPSPSTTPTHTPSGSSTSTASALPSTTASTTASVSPSAAAAGGRLLAAWGSSDAGPQAETDNWQSRLSQAAHGVARLLGLEPQGRAPGSPAVKPALVPSMGAVPSARVRSWGGPLLPLPARSAGEAGAGWSGFRMLAEAFPSAGPESSVSGFLDLSARAAANGSSTVVLVAQFSRLVPNITRCYFDIGGTLQFIPGVNPVQDSRFPSTSWALTVANTQPGGGTISYRLSTTGTADRCTDAEKLAAQNAAAGTVPRLVQASSVAPPVLLCTGNTIPAGNNTRCDPCPAGSIPEVATGRTTCQKCAAGKVLTLFSDSTSLSSAVAATYRCEDCPAGTFSSAEGALAGACQVCPAGRFADNPGASKCEICPQGSTTRLDEVVRQRTCSQPWAPPNCADTFVVTAANRTLCEACLASELWIGGTGLCIACRDDEVVVGETCQACEPGTFKPQGASVCSPCQAGRFRSTTRQPSNVDCLPCPGGTSSLANAVGCSLCKVGTFAPALLPQAADGLTECTPASPGFFQPIKPSEEARAILERVQNVTYAQEMHDAIAAEPRYAELFPLQNLPCPKGSFRTTAGNASCELCAPGRVAPVEGSSACTACTRGRVQPLRGQTECNDCAPGEFQDDEEGTVCKACSAGRSASDIARITSCVDCPVGRYQPLPGSTNCSDCGKGLYTNLQGSTTCERCPVGEFQATEGQANCQACAAGTYQNELGQSGCKLCPVGTANDKTRQEFCQPCFGSNYESEVGSTACTACTSSLVNRNGVWRSARVSTPDHSSGLTNCTACVTGTNCSGSVGTGDFAVSSDGFFWWPYVEIRTLDDFVDAMGIATPNRPDPASESRDVRIHECPKPGACQTVFVGQGLPNQSTTSARALAELDDAELRLLQMGSDDLDGCQETPKRLSDQSLTHDFSPVPAGCPPADNARRVWVNCTEGFEGVLCSRCRFGYFSAGEACSKCEPWMTGAGWVMTFLGMFAFCGYSWTLFSRELAQAKGPEKKDSFAAILKVIINFITITTALGEFASRGAALSREVLESLSVLNSVSDAPAGAGASTSSPLECAFGLRFYTTFYLWFAAPGIVGLLITITFMARWAFNRFWVYRDTVKYDWNSDDVPLEFRQGICTSFVNNVSKAINVFVVAYFLIYINISTNMLASQQLTSNIDGFKYVVTDYSIVAFRPDAQRLPVIPTEEYDVMNTVFLLGIALWVTGIPLILCLYLGCLKNRLLEPEQVSKWLFLYDGYDLGLQYGTYDEKLMNSGVSIAQGMMIKLAKHTSLDKQRRWRRSYEVASSMRLAGLEPAVGGTAAAPGKAKSAGAQADKRNAVGAGGAGSDGAAKAGHSEAESGNTGWWWQRESPTDAAIDDVSCLSSGKVAESRVDEEVIRRSIARSHYQLAKYAEKYRGRNFYYWEFTVLARKIIVLLVSQAGSGPTQSLINCLVMLLFLVTHVIASPYDSADTDFAEFFALATLVVQQFGSLALYTFDAENAAPIFLGMNASTIQTVVIFFLMAITALCFLLLLVMGLFHFLVGMIAPVRALAASGGAGGIPKSCAWPCLAALCCEDRRDLAQRMKHDEERIRVSIFSSSRLCCRCDNTPQCPAWCRLFHAFDFFGCCRVSVAQAKSRYASHAPGSNDPMAKVSLPLSAFSLMLAEYILDTSSPEKWSNSTRKHRMNMQQRLLRQVDNELEVLARKLKPPAVFEFSSTELLDRRRRAFEMIAPDHIPLAEMDDEGAPSSDEEGDDEGASAAKPSGGVEADERGKGHKKAGSSWTLANWGRRGNKDSKADPTAAAAAAAAGSSAAAAAAAAAAVAADELAAEKAAGLRRLAMSTSEESGDEETDVPAAAAGAGRRSHGSRLRSSHEAEAAGVGGDWGDAAWRVATPRAADRAGPGEAAAAIAVRPAGRHGGRGAPATATAPAAPSEAAPAPQAQPAVSIADVQAEFAMLQAQLRSDDASEVGPSDRSERGFSTSARMPRSGGRGARGSRVRAPAAPAGGGELGDALAEMRAAMAKLKPAAPQPPSVSVSESDSDSD